MSSVTFTLTVADNDVPLVGMDITGSSVGHTGHLTAECGMEALDAAGIDLVALSIASPASLEVDAFVSIDGETTQVFGGEYLNAKFHYNRQVVRLRARDWAGPLVDQKRVLVNILNGNNGALAPGEVAGDGVSTQNQKLSQLVTAIANQFGMTPDLRLAAGADPQVGTIFGDSQDIILTSTPQSLWGILNRLARDTGNIVYATPQKALVFGDPGAGLDQINLTYRLNPIPDGADGALMLDIDHNPRRNLTFRVLVLSYDPTTSTMTRGQAYVIGSNYSTGQGSVVHAGAWSGTAANNISNAIGTGSKSSKNAVPLYTFHFDGLTAAQAQQRATGIAADIAKRELIANVSSHCIPAIAPSNPATLSGLINPEFAAHQYFVSHYSHHFRMPEKDSERATFETHMLLLDRQPAGAGDSVSSGEVE